MSRLILTLKILCLALSVPVLPVSIVEAQGSVALGGELPVTELKWEYLWDPIASDLDEWRYIGRWPCDIEWGESNEIFISDTQNARVLHITTGGDLINVIGQRGDGPASSWRHVIWLMTRVHSYY